MVRSDALLRTALVGFLLTAAEVSYAAKFAVACTGRSLAIDTGIKPEYRSETDLETQIYVIDEERKLVQRALMPRQEFDTICSSKKGLPFVYISPGLISTRSAYDFSADSVECSFELDRKTGLGKSDLKINYERGGHHQLLWTMVCEKTEVPVFDTRKNKF